MISDMNLLGYLLVYSLSTCFIGFIFLHLGNRLKLDLAFIYNSMIKGINQEIELFSGSFEKIFVSYVKGINENFGNIEKKQIEMNTEMQQFCKLFNSISRKIEILNLQLDERTKLENEIVKLKKIIKRLEVK